MWKCCFKSYRVTFLLLWFCLFAKTAPNTFTFVPMDVQIVPYIHGNSQACHRGSWTPLSHCPQQWNGGQNSKEEKNPCVATKTFNRTEKEGMMPIIIVVIMIIIVVLPKWFKIQLLTSHWLDAWPASQKQPLTSFPPSLYSKHGLMWSGISLGSAGVSCPLAVSPASFSCPSASLLVGWEAERSFLDLQ